MTFQKIYRQLESVYIIWPCFDFIFFYIFPKKQRVEKHQFGINIVIKSSETVCHKSSEEKIAIINKSKAKKKKKKNC